MSLLELKGVCKNYWLGKGLFQRGKVIEAVKELDLVLEEGDSLGLVGESGSGKSTLARIILGLEKPDQGQVLFQGKDIYQLKRKELWELRRHLHTVFQDCYSSVNPRFSVARTIAEPLRNYERLGYQEEKKRVQELLQLVGLDPEDLNKYPHQFSGGQLQRISLARALALKPKLVILDEAVSGLDVSVQAQILNLLEDLRKELNLSYIFISHHIEVVNYISSCLGVMYMGRLVEYVAGEDLIQNLKHPYSQRLLASALPQHPRERKPFQVGKIPCCSHQHANQGCNYVDRCDVATQACYKQVPPLKTVQGTHQVSCLNF